MKILVIGASGLIGNALYKEFLNFGKVIGTYYSLKMPSLIYLDIRDETNTSNLIKSEKPDVILDPAGNPNVDECEIEPKKTWAINVEGNKKLIDYAEKIKSKFVFFSSEYIFDGVVGEYGEGAMPSPINEYGRQKVEVENYIKAKMDNFLIIRTTVVYGWEKRGKNFVMSLLRKLKNGEKVKVPIDQISSPTYVRNLAEGVKQLVEKEKNGIYNIAGCEIIDRFNFAKIVCDVFELDSSLLVSVPTSELGQKAKRPLKGGLRIDKIKREIGIDLLPPRQGLEMMRGEKWEI